MENKKLTFVLVVLGTIGMLVLIGLSFYDAYRSTGPTQGKTAIEESQAGDTVQE